MDSLGFLTAAGAGAVALRWLAAARGREREAANEALSASLARKSAYAAPFLTGGPQMAVEHLDVTHLRDLFGADIEVYDRCGTAE